MSPRAAARLESLGFGEVYDYEGGKVDWMAFDLPVEGESAGEPRIAGALVPDAPTCALDESAGTVLDRMSPGGWTWCAVLNDQRVVLGRVRRPDLERAPHDTRVADLMAEGPSTYRPSLPCQEMVEAMKSGGFELAFVTDSDGRWLGLVSRQAAEARLDGWRRQKPGAA